MWWLRRMTTATIPCWATRSIARAIALAVSQIPGNRRPSQVTAPPRSATTSGWPTRRHAAGLEFAEVGRGQLQSVRRVAEQVGFDQAGSNRPRLVAVAAGRGKQSSGKIHKLAGTIARLCHDGHRYPPGRSRFYAWLRIGWTIPVYKSITSSTNSSN